MSWEVFDRATRRRLSPPREELNALVRAVAQLGYTWSVNYPTDPDDVLGPPTYRLTRGDEHVEITGGS
jgi:hypothetical protein